MSIAEIISKNILQTAGMMDLFLQDFSDADMLFPPGEDVPIMRSGRSAIWPTPLAAMVTSCDPNIAVPL